MDSSGPQKYGRLTKENIFKYISQEEIMSRYLVPYTKRLIKNPMRKDKSPGCGFFYTRDGRLLFHDFALGKAWDCFGVVMEQYHCSFYESLKIIDQDFGLNLRHYSESTIKRKRKEIERPAIELNKAVYHVTTKEWTDEALSYWKDYHISKTTLTKFHVLNTDVIYRDNKEYLEATDNNPIFTYIFPSGAIQIYRPIGDKKYKWRTTTSLDDLHGYSQLPSKGDIIFITSSRKDVMVLYELGYSAVAPIGEASSIKKEFIEDLKNRFKRVVVLYDNDEPGRKLSTKLGNKHDFEIFTWKESEEKDISDNVKSKGIVYNKEMLETWLTSKQN